MQEDKHIARQSMLLQGKNLEIEFVGTIHGYVLDSHVNSVTDDEINKLKKQYHALFQRALARAPHPQLAPALSSWRTKTTLLSRRCSPSSRWASSWPLLKSVALHPLSR